ncbi:bacteriocin biosynthesis cyclodehydratase domain-containing protein [Arthrobacter woluwensis]|uniref:TOMM precursor leader peptide-binding protein n=1 Tax=Arthrobacter woluwensis TaxID=156980 RepID=UPI00278613C3|nr:TOMM precursor leader peptide-binding protein [Arthrobacter woluwensis]MDQ0708362.1 bacteriocin biosynthesis cyclodehydratase domain-containing protein [Arthrobacter woluwensis]
MSTTYVVAEGVRQADFEDSFVLVCGSSIVRFREHQELARELFRFLGTPRTLDEVAEGVPGLGGQERLLGSLRAAGVVAAHRGTLDRLAGLPVFDPRTDRPALRLDVPEHWEAHARRVLSTFTAIDVEDRDSERAGIPTLIIRPSVQEAIDVCRDAWEQGQCHVPVVPFDGGKLVVGPAVLPGTSACFECLVIRRAATTDWPDEYLRFHRTVPSGDFPPHDFALGVHLAARLAVAAFYRDAHDLIGSCSVINPGTLTSYNSRVWSVPRCPSCSQTGRSSTSYPWLAPASSGQG